MNLLLANPEFVSISTILHVYLGLIRNCGREMVVNCVKLREGTDEVLIHKCISICMLCGVFGFVTFMCVAYCNFQIPCLSYSITCKHSACTCLCMTFTSISGTG